MLKMKKRKSKLDLVLLHAPSVYDFRKKFILYGPISDVIPSTSIFEMYPVGFSSILEYLEKNGFRVKIVNLALLMLNSKKFNAEALIKKLNPGAFGIDLHWLVHAHGSLEIANICKKYHPDIPVIFGGFSSTYFVRELISYPQVDFVLMGDSAERPLLELLNVIADAENVPGKAYLEIEKKVLEKIPNLAWKDKCGSANINQISDVPDNINEYSNNYQHIFKSAVKLFDVGSLTPIYDWWGHPIVAVVTNRGCNQNCIICGGSKYALKKYCNRLKTAFRGPELIAKDIEKVAEVTDAPIFIVGDLRQPGEDYADIVLNGLRGKNIKNQIILELFECAPSDYFKKVSASIENINFQISPETHDENIRKLNGKFYTNKQFEDNIQSALGCGCNKIDVFFMVGLSGQSYQSVMDTVDYCKYLLEKFSDKRVIPFISPLAPFLDPGSIAYENSGEFGYKIFYRTLEEYRNALLAPSWKYTLNYETEWMSRYEIVDATYQSALRLNKIKYDSGIIDEKIFKKVDANIKDAIEIDRKIDFVLKEQHSDVKDIHLKDLKFKIDRAVPSILCDKDELKWPAGKKRFKILNIIKNILAG